METKKDYSGAKWYKEITIAFQSLANTLEVEPQAVSELQAFLVQKCRDQYNTGNKSGIAWARKKFPPNPNASQEAPSRPLVGAAS